MNKTREALAAIKKLDETFFLFPPETSVLVPLSLGDHSLFLLECLKRYSLYSKKSFKPVPLCFRFASDAEPLEGYEAVLHLEVEQDEEALSLARKNPSSHCEKLKRLAYVKEARERGCSLISLPTTFDDLHARYERNLLSLGKINTYLPYTKLSQWIAFIRPLLALNEEDIGEAEKELKISCHGQIRKPVYPRSQKDSFLKAIAYGEFAPNLPLLRKREALSRAPDLYWVKDGEEYSAYDHYGMMMGCFDASELDAHRIQLSSLFFFECAPQKEIIASFVDYWASKKKKPLQFFIDMSEQAILDETWLLNENGCYVKKVLK